MWGMYHTRWWLVQKIVAICSKGFFDANEATERIYCRLMGAKIGRNVKLEGATIGEWDLIEIGDDCNLTKCICRPFAAEGNTSMYLGRITIGGNCSVGVSSIIAPGTTMPPDTCLGFNSSSWEMQDASEEYRDQLPSEKPKPHWLLNLLFTMPLKHIGLFLSAVPWMAGLVGMVTTQGQEVNHKAPLRSSVDWFTQPNRIAYHYLALALGCLFGPFFLFGFVILVKSILDCIFGKLKANSRSTVDIWRANLIKALLPEGKFHQMASLFGQHYEATSIALRMLGAKIGERVYWPGTGPSIGDYHLIDVGNDVVFGSRSHLVTSDGIGSEKVTIQDRAMIADRVCLLPGVTVGERTTMGSGALTKRNGNYVSDGTYVGSKAGDAVCLSSGSDTKVSRSHIRNMQSEDTLTNEKKFKDEKDRPDTQPSTRSGSDTERSDGKDDWAQHPSPFGRAFYLKLAPYHVLGPLAIFLYSAFFTVFTAVYWDVPSVSSIQFVGIMFRSSFPRGMNVWFDLVAIFLTMLAGIAILSTIQSVLALAIIIGSKWLLMGRRKAGNYDWDKSPYCQRWQIFLGIERLRRQCYKGNGKDCALFVNGTPSLMFTEPDLMTLGNRVVVDDASVVAHINTRGKFDVNKVEIGDRCVLRTGSRLLSDAQMKSDSCLLEHTLIMGGDVVEERRIMQGWPAEELKNALIGISVLTFSTVVFFALHTSPHLPFRPSNIETSWVPSDPPSWPPQPAENSRYTDRLVNYKPEHPVLSEVQPIESKRLAVLLPTFDGHFPQVFRYFQSVKCLCVDHNKVDWHIIVSNSAEVEGLTKLLSTLEDCNQTFSRWNTPKDNIPGKDPVFNIVNLYDILPARLRTDLSPEDTSGLLKKYDKYAYQSIKKMSAAEHFDYDLAMWLDSEAIFVAPGKIRDIFEGHLQNPIVWRSRMSFQDREKFLMSKAAATLGRSIDSFGDQLWLLESLQWIIEKPIWTDMVSSVEMAHGGNFWDIWIESSYPFELLVYYLHIIARKMETANSIFSNYRILETERELIRFGLAESISEMEGRRGTGFMERLPHLIAKPHSVLAPNLVAFCKSYSLRALRMDNVDNFEESALDSFLIDGDIKLLVSGAPDIHKWWDDRIQNGENINNTATNYRSKDIWKASGKYQSDVLAEQFMKTSGLLEGDEQASFYEANGKCKVFVCAHSKANNSPVNIRSYTTSTSVDSLSLLPCKIWEAARATSAASGFFDPIKIGWQDYVDGATGRNIPVEEVFNEAKVIWPDEPSRIQYFVSIGTGIPEPKDFGENLAEIQKAIIAITTETKDTERRFYENHESYLNGPRVQDIIQKFTQFVPVSSVYVTVDEKANNEYLNWLPYLDSRSTHNDARRYRTDSTTGNWFLEHSFKDWKAKSNSFMWLHANVGSGKTILSSTIIDHLEKQGEGTVAFLYFSYHMDKDQTHLSRLFRISLIQQILRPLIEPVGPNFLVPRRFRELYHKYQPSQEPSDEDLEAILRYLLDLTPQTFIIVDALDECSPRGDQLDVIETLGTISLMAKTECHIIITSRKEQLIEEAIRDLPLDKKIIPFDIAEVNADISHHLLNVVKSKPCSKWSPELQNEVTKHLVNRADGVFRWADLQIRALAGQVREKDVRRALSRLPQGLEATYERMLNRIDDQDKFEEAYAVFRWIAFSTTRLNLAAVSELAAFEIEDPDCSPESDDFSITFSTRNRFEEPTEMQKLLSSLVIIPGDDNPYRTFPSFAHSTVLEYLTSPRVSPTKFHLDRMDATWDILKSSWAYMRHYDTSTQRSKVKPYPLLEYACYQLWECALELTRRSISLKGQVSKHMTSISTEGLSSDGTSSKFSVWWFCHRMELPKSFLTMTVLDLLSSSELQHQVPSWDSLYLTTSISNGTLLIDAAGAGESRVVKLLLDMRPIEDNLRFLDMALRGASRKPKDLFKPYRSIISGGENTTVLTELLQVGADVNGVSLSGDAAIHLAATHGHIDIVTFLSEGQEVHLDSPNGKGETPLLLASMHSHTAIVALLLSLRGSVSHRGDEEGRTPLSWAATRGNKAVFELLHRDQIVDVNKEDCHGRTPLIWASIAGQGDYIKSL
ncbi:coenzyme A synthetase [Fusarium bulbicola]|nr:coenzyme A synthetase [Fusarium bulbicola]